MVDPIVNLKLSDERHIVIQTEREETHLFLYSINGNLIRSKKLDYPVADMLLSNESIVLAVNHIPSVPQGNKPTNKESAGLVAARIIIKDMFE